MRALIWFIEAKKPWPDDSTFAYWWQTIDVRVLLCVEEVARASTSSHLPCHFDGFMVNRDVPPETSSQQFLDNLATAPADHHGVHHPFRLEGALLLHTALCPYRPTDAPFNKDDLGEGVVLALVPRRWGS